MQWNEFRSHIRHFTQQEQTRIHEAFLLGEQKHDGQKRKSGEPYFHHPIAVAEMLTGMGADADTVIAALLHDTVEDTDLTLDEIDGQFDSTVRSLIEGVTKLSAEDVAEKPNLDEQIETLRKIFTLMETDIRIMVIKLVDRLHNMQTVEFLPEKRKLAIAQETNDVYVKLSDLLCMQDVRDELKGLCLSVLEPGVFAQLSRLRSDGETLGHSTLARMGDQMRRTDAALTQSYDIHYEHKDWEDLRTLFNTGGTTVTGISNLTAVFVCPDVSDCYRVLGLLHQIWKRETLSFQDYINAPMINGYRGLHTTVILEDGTRVRCKMRTKEMHEYARKGVTVHCFQPDSHSLLGSLPWLERIAPLSKDTRDRSREFLQNLQSDILEESITIHGPGDNTVSLPKGSTALDGAFYIFGDDALSIVQVKVDGKEVRFSAPLKHATSLDGVFAKKLTVQREWLDWTKTGMATAKIRDSLTHTQSKSEKTEIGKRMVQTLMNERRKGFIEEFQEDALTQKIQAALGYSSLEETYHAIADGRVTAKEVYSILFEQKNHKSRKPLQGATIRYMVNTENEETMTQIRNVQQKYRPSLKEIRLNRSKKKGYSSVSIKMESSKDEIDAFAANLRHAGAENIEIILRSRREFLLLGTVIILWALNPVAANALLHLGMDALSLLTIRFLTFAIFTTLFFAGWLWSRKGTYQRIQSITTMALLPTFSNALFSLGTYLALTYVPPSVHLTVLRLNSLLLPSLTEEASRKTRMYLMIFLLLLGLLAIASYYTIGSGLTVGLVLSLWTLCCYILYSLSTEHTLQQNKIEFRYPVLLFQTGILLGLCGLVLAFLQPLDSIFNVLTPWAVLYVLVCVCIPHTSYIALLKTARFKHFTDMQLAEVPLAIVMEIVFLGIILPPALYVVIFGILSLLLLLRWQSVHIFVE